MDAGPGCSSPNTNNRTARAPILASLDLKITPAGAFEFLRPFGGADDRFAGGFFGLFGGFGVAVFGHFFEVGGGIGFDFQAFVQRLRNFAGLELARPVGDAVIGGDFVADDFASLADERGIERGAGSGTLHELLAAGEQAHHGIAFLFARRHLVQLEDVAHALGAALDGFAIFFESILQILGGGRLFHFGQRFEQQFFDVQQFPHFIPKDLLEWFHKIWSAPRTIPARQAFRYIQEEFAQRCYREKHCSGKT